MEVPKIHLSSAETELMLNAEIILTKNRVLEKIRSLLEGIMEQQTAFVENHGLLAAPAFMVSPKISRGENYLGLPWLILDFPRRSGGEDLFFVRTMFWWGRFFSSTLHLAGRYRQAAREQIAGAYPLLCDYFIGVSEDPWQHHFEATNYQPINRLTEQQFRLACDKAHLKIAKKWPLERWQQAPPELYKNWEFLIKMSGLIT